jgi:hypothetical protein
VKVVEEIAEKRAKWSDPMRSPGEAAHLEYFSALHNAWPAIERALRFLGREHDHMPHAGHRFTTENCAGCAVVAELSGRKEGEE